ncbi:unnamed protein product (macronuclear) [Paramecium tetraurelia]|uniref:RING-type domain-containing protein n=1 Tax=Paramecium tetraurelia TaxID=5888 RepID=A0BWM0_PARTE|nr:uncharacterized protein GSPATT00032789001 [Paramecium tetraurelia]CAK62937.1 unnamed protein product [Paramecium tetraurelia]|eukprot:XP_001430335.1 hypothetical protein (macronuclear) [Paramecium tetraurelia strain d4-2]
MIQNSSENITTSIPIQNLEDESPNSQSQQQDEQTCQSPEENVINQPIAQLDQDIGQQVQDLQQIEQFDPRDYDQVSCPYCDTEMFKKDYWVHVGLCEEQISYPDLVEQQCRQCGDNIVKQYLNDHLKVCQYDYYGEVKCPYCSFPIVKAWLKEHIAECDGYKQEKLREMQGIKNCYICLEDITENNKILKCSHSFHEDCIQKWLKVKQTCPLCQSLITEVKVPV